MKKKIIIIIGIIISFVSFAFTFMYYKSNNRLTIYTSDGSYAYKYAKKNMIKTFNVSDSHEKYFHKVWEDFKFNKDKDGLVITKYEGISEELIIPTTYNDEKIIKIEKNALPTTVKKIFLPDSVKDIEIDDFKNIEIMCYKGSFCDNLKENDKLNVKILDDVDRYILDEKDLEFTYNTINNNEIELTNYLGSEEIILIPETINGYKVTSISFDGKGVSAIFIPETVNSISGNITSKLFNECFAMSIIIILLALIVYCIPVILVKVFELIDKTYIFTVSIIYLIVVNYFLYVMRNNPFENTKYLMYSIIASVIYLFITYLLSIVIKNNKKYDSDIKHKNDFIKEINLLLQDYDFKELKEISDMIRYSDPVSIPEVTEIEKNIKDEIKSINDDNVKDKISIIKKLIKKRNQICKDNK